MLSIATFLTTQDSRDKRKEGGGGDDMDLTESCREGSAGPLLCCVLPSGITKQSMVNE